MALLAAVLLLAACKADGSGNDGDGGGSDPDGATAAVDAPPGTDLDGAAPDDDAASNDPDANAGLVRTVVGVGYGGIRAASQDLGLNWPFAPAVAPGGGDDEDLLRGVAYGNGVWLAASYDVQASTDARTWMPLEAQGNCGLTEGLAFGDGVFLMSCCCDAQDAAVRRSTDGVEWEEVANIPVSIGRHGYVVYADGRFGASGDDGDSYVSDDHGDSWQPLPGITNVLSCEGALKSRDDCNGAFWMEGGIWLSTEWAGYIRRSTDGQDWDTVFDDEGDNTIFDNLHPAFADGYAPPVD